MSAIQTGISLLDGLISKAQEYKLDLSEAKSVSIYNNMITINFTFSDQIYNNLMDSGFEFKPHDPGVTPHLVATKQVGNFLTMIFLFY
jgi:hypothetical protein